MNVLVTGATGFVGSALVEELVKEGHKVTVISRQPTNLSNLKQLKVNLCYTSFTDLDSLRRVAKGKEIIFHLAGLINAPRERNHIYYQANVSTTRSLLKAADRTILKSFVYCSSVAVYGKLKKIPANERTRPQPDNFYGQSKYEAEKVCLEFVKEENLPVVIIRPTWVYGPRDKRTFKLFKTIDRRMFRIIGRGEVLIHPIFIYDLVEGLKLSAFNKNTGGKIFIIGGNEVVDLDSLVKQIAKSLLRPNPKMHIPLGAAKTAAFVLENMFLLFGKRAPLSQRALEFFTSAQRYDISLAKKELSFEPRYSLAEGINKTVSWYREKGWL